VTVHQDASLYVTRLSAGHEVVHALAPSRHAWVQVASGTVGLNGIALGPGDGAALTHEARIELRASTDAEVLVFDLA
jgi:redox-sensitive bicupin YhaK (pirin superfamily)